MMPATWTHSPRAAATTVFPAFDIFVMANLYLNKRVNLRISKIYKFCSLLKKFRDLLLNYDQNCRDSASYWYDLVYDVSRSPYLKFFVKRFWEPNMCDVRLCIGRNCSFDSIILCSVLIVLTQSEKTLCESCACYNFLSIFQTDNSEKSRILSDYC